jgi:hypothetical protein
MPALLLVALGAGIAASFVVSRVWPTFTDAASLREITDLPVLGVISRKMDENEKRAARRQAIGFFSAFGGLIVMIGGATATVLLLALRAA